MNFLNLNCIGITPEQDQLFSFTPELEQVFWSFGAGVGVRLLGTLSNGCWGH